MAQRKRHRLHRVRIEPILVVQHTIVRGPRRALDPRMGLQEEVELERVHHPPVDDRARLAVLAPVGLLGVGGVLWEEADVVALADDDEGELGADVELGTGRCRRECACVRGL